MKLIIRFLFIFIFSSILLNAQPEKVSLQLLWKHQFEFAGFYMAKEKGFYKDLNLDVEIKEFKFGTNITNDVQSGKSTFGVAYPNIILDKSNGAKITLLSSIFQFSPHVLITLKSSGIKSIKDFKNKRIMIANDAIKTAPLISMLYSENTKLSDMTILNPSFNINDLIDDNTDIFSAYISNEVYKLNKRGLKYNVWNPSDYGFDFYNDILFTSSKLLKDNPEQVKNFQSASLKGWEYAFLHINETIDVILKKYNTQKKSKEALIYEAKTLQKLAYGDNEFLGEITKDKIQRIYDIYNLMGLTKNKINLDNFIYKPISNKINLTFKEQTYLKKHKTITVHNEQNWPPYNFNIDGKPKGFSIDYMNLLASKLDIKIKYISGFNWSQFMNMIKNEKLDVMLNIRDTKKRKKFINFTTKYIEATKSIFTNNINIKSLNDLNGKTVAVPKDFFIHKFLEKNYPNINLNIQEDAYSSIIEALNGNADAIVGDFAVTTFLLQEKGLAFKYSTIVKDNNLTSKMNIGTSLNQPILRDILQKAMNQVSDEEINNLKSKWLGKMQLDAKSVTISNIYTKEEQAYLENNPIIKMCNNPNWEPIEFKNKDNEMNGIAIDTMKLIEKKLNVKFQSIDTKNWTQSQQFLKKKKCDILPAAIKTAKREKYAKFTTPYLNYKLAVITKNDKPFINGIEDIIDKSISRKKGSGLIHKLKAKYPNINIVQTKDYLEALQKVSQGEVYCTVTTLPIASYYINHFALNNLHIAGYTNMTYRLSVAVRNDYSILLSILNKTLATISKDEHKNIYNKWANVKLNEKFDYTYLVNSLILIFVIVVLIIYRQILLKKQNKNLQAIVDEKTRELKEINENLEQKIVIEVDKSKKREKQLFESAKMAQMGEMIGNIAHQWRQPLSIISTAATGMKLEKEYGILEDKRFNEACDLIDKNSQYLSKTIDTFRNFIKEKKSEQNVVLQDRIDIAIDITKPILDNNHIKLINEIDYTNPIEHTMTIGELSQVIINIINNAKDILMEKNIQDPWIKIILQQQNNNVMITIEDNGGGIEDDYISKIFDPYFTTKHQSQGTGLGLHMSYKIITESLNGKIYVKNTNEGAKFFIDFPIKNN